MDDQNVPKTEDGETPSQEIDFVTLGMFIIGTVHPPSLPT